MRTINNKATPPAWADRLWVSTSANTDTFVWVNSEAKGHGHGGELHTAKHAEGITGSQTSGGFETDSVVCNSGCQWQLAGVRKKTVWVPEPEVVKPGVLMTTPTVRAAQAEQAFYGTCTGRSPQMELAAEMDSIAAAAKGRGPSLNERICAPYGTDIYSKIARELGISRGATKVRLFRELYTPPRRGQSQLFNVDFAAIERSMLAYRARDVLGTPKPPVGVQPRNLHDEARANELDEAMVRYLNEDLPFPIEWATEWNELRARLNKEQK